MTSTACVLAPLNSLDGYQLIVDAGARELYVGFYSPAWEERFGKTEEMNRLSGFSTGANALTLADVVKLAGWCARDGVKLFVTFNASYYSPEGSAFIAEQFLPALAKAQIAGIIVSSTQLIEHALALGIPCVASTLCDITNHLIAQEYRNLGVSRIVLPRHLSLDEIEEIIDRVPDVEYEVFAMRNGCVFADSHCLGAHRNGRPSLCRSLREGTFWECPTGADAAKLSMQVMTNEIWSSQFHQRTCGLCATKRLIDAGACSFKVVGRCDDPADIAESVRLLAGALDAAAHSANDRELIAQIERPQPLDEYCGRGNSMSCYYAQSTFADPKSGMR